MVTDSAAYEELCEREYWVRLSQMTMQESIAVGEALLTSELMDRAQFAPEEPPLSLARRLGIEPILTSEAQ